jgi:cytidine deaminase
MEAALAEAEAAARIGEVPVGAAILDAATGRIIARAGNRTRAQSDPTAHAEILAIRAACAALGTDRLPGLDIFVTLEPCPMCAAAISFARLRRLYYGAADPKSGGVEQGPRMFEHPQCHHRPDIYAGLAETRSSRLLAEFFARLR